MKIECVIVGMLRCNSYILDINNSVIVIDPGDDVLKIISKIGMRKVVGIIITHHHFDHDGGSLELARHYNTSIYDKNNLCDGENKIGNFSFFVISTPGHRDDLITIYFKNYKCMFCGDFIFKNGIGRCDLEYGDTSKMIDSIKKIKKYDRNITIYPGHGDITTLGYEMDNNIYFRSDINYL